MDFQTNLPPRVLAIGIVSITVIFLALIAAAVIGDLSRRPTCPPCPAAEIKQGR